MSTLKTIEDLLGAEAKTLLEHRCKGISQDVLHLPGPDFVDRVHAGSDRPPAVLRNLQQILSHGRLAGTGYVSILPVDQGIEHSAGASFAPNPAYFDPENIVRLAMEGGCNAVASTLGVPGGGGAQVRPQDPVPDEVQPQRVPHLSQQVRPDPLREGQAGLGHGRRGGRSHHLFRIRRVLAPDRGGGPGLSTGPRAGDGHGPLVLSAEHRLQDQGEGLPCRGRLDGPGQPSGRHPRGRHHQAEAAREQRRLRGPQHERGAVREDRQAGLLGADAATTPST